MNDRYQSTQDRDEEEHIKAYLSAHSDFFSRHPETLEGLALPHDTGAATSLVERQVSVLRQRNVELRHRLNELIETARLNDLLFENSKQLMLKLLDSPSLAALVDTLYHSLRHEFHVPEVSVLLFERDNNSPAPAPARWIDEQQVDSQVGVLLHSKRPLCGILRGEEVAFLFGQTPTAIGSVAAIRLGREQPIGILALGNTDPHYYQSTTGTLFLTYIADVLDRLLPRLL